MALPVDVGKNSAMVMVCDFTGRVLVPAVEFAMTRDGAPAAPARLCAGLPADTRPMRVGVGAVGHYHRPLTAGGVRPNGWPWHRQPELRL